MTTETPDQDDSTEPTEDDAPKNAGSGGGTAHDATIQVEENE